MLSCEVSHVRTSTPRVQNTRMSGSIILSRHNHGMNAAVRATSSDLMLATARRDVLIALMGCSCQAAALNVLSAVAANAASAAATPTSLISSSSSSTAPASSPKDPTFYARWPYASPADIVPYIEQEAARGDGQSVLNAMDNFSLYYPQYKIGPEKGVLFEQVLGQVKPHLALELGTFLGYSAIRTARNLAPNGRLICIEANPENASVARQLLDYAGVPAGQVVVLEGLASQVIPQLPQLLQTQGLEQQGQQPPLQGAEAEQTSMHQSQLAFDFVFLDHSKNDYLPDLQRLEQLGLVQAGSTVMADNVVYPGAPGFLEYLDSSGRYNTELLRAKYEYEQAWNPDWELGKEDAMSWSVCLS